MPGCFQGIDPEYQSSVVAFLLENSSMYFSCLALCFDKDLRLCMYRSNLAKQLAEKTIFFMTLHNHDKTS